MSRQTVRKLTQELKFSLVDQTKMVTATSELARNTVVYGGGGEMRWEILTDGLRRGLRVHFEDQGPGIPDLDLALTDGWTSGSGLGMGLSGSKRLVHEFEIRSAVGEGTRVSITRWK
ncbi:anti-sigma regulatory factor [Caldimonas brevitalea]